ncbi:hypothetical protein, partial [Frankia sp. AgB32]|uniref:hypothetical protein n=1 Tax=Frankia sp. AgB32 TaxID=631119 RepID=UPI00200E3FC6
VVLVLRAFANGCTALTGVEAISNGVAAGGAPPPPPPATGVEATQWSLHRVCARPAYAAQERTGSSP